VSPKHRGRIFQGRSLSSEDSWPTQQLFVPIEEIRLLTDIKINAYIQADYAEFIQEQY
jgi:hypothetical protein